MTFAKYFIGYDRESLFCIVLGIRQEASVTEANSSVVGPCSEAANFDELMRGNWVYFSISQHYVGHVMISVLLFWFGFFASSPLKAQCSIFLNPSFPSSYLLIILSVLLWYWKKKIRGSLCFPSMNYSLSTLSQFWTSCFNAYCFIIVELFICDKHCSALTVTTGIKWSNGAILCFCHLVWKL